jgi:hypothetical protein
MTITYDRMTLIELVEKAADIDPVREMLAFAAKRIMDAAVKLYLEPASMPCAER